MNSLLPKLRVLSENSIRETAGSYKTGTAWAAWYNMLQIIYSLRGKNKLTCQVECFTNPWDFCDKSMWKKPVENVWKGKLPSKKNKNFKSECYGRFVCQKPSRQISSLPAEQVGFSLRGSYSDSWNVFAFFFSMGKCKLTKLPSLKHLCCGWQCLPACSSLLQLNPGCLSRLFLLIRCWLVMIYFNQREIDLWFELFKMNLREFHLNSP